MCCAFWSLTHTVSYYAHVTDEEINLPQDTQLLNETNSILTSQKKERRRPGDCNSGDLSSSSYGATTYLGDLAQVTPVLFHPLQIKGSYFLVALVLSYLNILCFSDICAIIDDYL